MKKNNNLKTISILFYVACGLCILMAIVSLISVFKDVNAYVTNLANSYFGENGSLTSMLNTYVENGIYTEEQAKSVMNLSLKLSLYSVILFSILNIIFAILVIVLVLKLKPLINEPKTLLLNHSKLTKTIKTLAILLTIFEVFSSELFPLDPIFIVLIVATVKFSKEIRDANDMAMLAKAYQDKGIKIDIYGNIINEKKNVEPKIVEEPIQEEKIYEAPKEDNFFYEEPKKQTSEDMEKIYLGLAELEKKYKNMQISEQDYLEEKTALLNKIK